MKMMGGNASPTYFNNSYDCISATACKRGALLSFNVAFSPQRLVQSMPRVLLIGRVLLQ